MNAKKCDRCGVFYCMAQEVEKRPSYVGQKIFKAKIYGTGFGELNNYDLCVDCAVKLMVFLKGAEVSND